MLPHEFSDMVKAVKSTHLALLGSEVPKSPAFFKRSILVSSPISTGDLLSSQNLRVARPGDGMCPSRWDEVLGKFASKDMSVGHPLTDGDIT